MAPPVNATTLVLVLGTTALFIIVAISLSTGPRSALPPEHLEHWLVRWLGRHARVGRLVRSIDRRVSGGIAVVATFLVVLVGATGVGYLFDSLDRDRGFARWDESVAEWGASVASPASTDVLSIATFAGASLVLAALMTAVGAFDRFRRGSWAGSGFLALVGVGIVVINNGLKLLVMRDRPLVPHLVGASGSSFPSGHSAAAAACWAALALVLADHVPRRRRGVLAGVAVAVTAIVAASRALLGVHWLTDVIAGVLVGWTWFLLVAVVFGGRIIRLGEPAAASGRVRTAVRPGPRTRGEPGSTRQEVR